MYASGRCRFSVKCRAVVCEGQSCGAIFENLRHDEREFLTIPLMPLT
jgi:hypothetical protein